MYRVNCISTSQGFYNVEQLNDEHYNYWLVITDQENKICGVIKDASLSEYENSRHDGFLTRKLGKAIEKALKENSMETTTFYWPYEFGLELTARDILDCSHTGACDKDCERVIKKEYIQEQLRDVKSEDIVEALVMGGVEIEDETDRDELYLLIVWDAACNLHSEIFGSLYA